MSEATDEVRDQVRLDFSTGEVWVNPDLEMADKARTLIHQMGEHIIRLERRQAMLLTAIQAVGADTPEDD